jgi:hypothetical protein
MIDILLCHSETASDIAGRIASRLETGAEAKVWMEEISPSFTLFEAWDGGLTSTGILVVLSPDAVPSKINRQDWEAILAHIAQNRKPEMAFVLSAECAYPRLLERRNFFRWDADALNVLRAIERWAIALHIEERSREEIAVLPWFAAREQEMQWLYSHLVDNSGATVTLAGEPAAGKTALAQEFARSAARHFRDVVWVGCGESSDAFIVGDISSQLGCARPDAVPELLHEHRVLAVFDDVRRPIPVGTPARGRASVLATTRDVSIATGAILEVHPAAVIHVESPADQTQRSLWHAMAVCNCCGFPEHLPVAIAGLQPQDACVAIQRLIEAGLVDRPDHQKLRLHDVSRLAALKTADLAQLRSRHAHIVYDSFCLQLPSCDALIVETSLAIAYACRQDWQMAIEISLRVSEFLRGRGRNQEAAETLRHVLSEARLRSDDHAIQAFEWEISWLQDGSDRVRTPIRAPQQLPLIFSA